jgi:hypothetical protein
MINIKIIKTKYIINKTYYLLYYFGIDKLLYVKYFYAASDSIASYKLKSFKISPELFIWIVFYPLDVLLKISYNSFYFY